MLNPQQLARFEKGQGFIAALDQSGGSTPGALKRYGIAEDRYGQDGEMFDLVHAMRERIVMSPSFSGEHILGAILFEQTMERSFAGKDAADYLWEEKHIIPFLKVDKGLASEADGVRPRTFWYSRSTNPASVPPARLANSVEPMSEIGSSNTGSPRWSRPDQKATPPASPSRPRYVR